MHQIDSQIDVKLPQISPELIDLHGPPIKRSVKNKSSKKEVSSVLRPPQMAASKKRLESLIVRVGVFLSGQTTT